MTGLLKPPVPVVQVVQVFQVQVVQNTTETPQLQSFEKTVEIPESFPGQDTKTSESLGAAPVRRVCFAETVDVMEVRPLLPAKS